ncbi:MAG: ABC-type branched-chain amino acid transport system, periplasmic component [Acidimicrobiales bacterium]|jgi:hypothetical protein|nr:ABC-type branched-chain amino acid transport system, periplasmic component [Acidimicrobiales bacterium]
MFQVALAMVLVAGACGHSSKSSTSSSGTQAPTVTTGGANDIASGDFGTLKDVCGAGSAKGATDVGVTDTEIHVATISDPGFTANPGLNKELFDVADGFVGWCNSLGGINGRKLVLDKLDAKVTEYKARIDEACPKTLALAGDGSVGDFAGAQARVDCGLVEFPAFTASPPAADAQIAWQTQPNPTDQLNPGPPLKLLSSKIPDSWTNQGGMIFDVAKTNQERNCQGVAKLGGKCVYQGVLSAAGEASYAPFVQASKAAGVKELFWIGDEHTATAILKAMSDQSAFPAGFLTSPNHYTESFVKLAGSLAGQGKIYTYSQSVPFEEAGTNPLIAKYLSIMSKFSPNAPHTGLAVTGFDAWLLFATNAKACGSTLTRACLSEKAATVTQWDAGGLQTPADVAHNRVSPCTMLLEMTSTGWKRFAPDSGFACDATSVADIPGLGLGAKKKG